MKPFLEEATALQSQLVAWRRHLHQNPETGMRLTSTAAFVKEQLEAMGYDAQYMAGSGVTAVAGGMQPGKCFLLRADMDALPVAEEAGVAYKATNGAMHACGHDLHTAMLLGAAKLLKEHENEIKGRVKLMFQPGEETLEGAKAMVEAGILENPRVDAAAMFHVAAGMPIPSGLILVPEGGAFSSASDWFEITIKGKGGHGAMPESTVDPLNVMSHLHLALQALNSREISSTDNFIVTVGMMQGGEASNVIPDTALMKGTIRTYDPKVRAFIFERLPAIARGVAATFRAEAEPVIIEGCPSVINDGAVAGNVRACLREALGDAVGNPAALGFARMGGSEDFSFVTQHVPSVMMLLSAGSPEEGYAHPVHHPKATFNEAVLCKGAAAYALAATGWLEKNS